MNGDRRLRFDALVVALNGVLVVGGYVLVWADNQGLVQGNQLFSLWAIPLYFGFGTAAYILLLAWIRRRGSAAPIADEYRFAEIGAAVFVVALIAEFLWRSFGGRPPAGPEGVLSPTRLALFGATIMLLTGPLLSIAEVRRAEPPARRHWPDRQTFTAAVALGLILSVLTLLLSFVHPFVTQAAVAKPNSNVQAPTDLYAVPTDASGSRRLTTTAELYEAHPSVSADGKRIAFARGPRDNFRLYTMAVAGGDEHELAAFDRHSDGPLWLADGSALMFWADVSGGVTATATPAVPAPEPAPSTGTAPVNLSGAGIWTVSLSGGNPRLLTGRGGEGAESWAPTGDRFCGWSLDGDNFDLAVWDVATGEKTIVVGGPSNEWGCSWSPDGSRLAFHSDRSGDYQIYTVAPDGSELRQVTQSPGISQLPRWSPDGSKLAYISSRTREFEIYVANADGSNARDISNDPALDDGFYGIAWLPDGTAVVAASSGRTYAASPDVTIPFGIASLVLTALILAAMLLVTWRFAPGTVGLMTVVSLINGALLAFVVEQPLLILPVAAAGLAADAVVWPLGATEHSSGLRTVGLAAVAAFVFTAAYFAIVAVTGGVAWDADLIIGTVLLATLLAGAGAFLFAAPLHSRDSTIRPSDG